MSSSEHIAAAPSNQSPRERDRANGRSAEQRTVKVCVVGSGSTFLSGISYYTHRLINALAEEYEVSGILVRRLLPRRLYPGRERVGAPLTKFSYTEGVEVYEGIDWFWGASALVALRFLSRRRPDVLVLQWWSGTVLHTYLLLAMFARLRGTRLVMEFHEVLDVGELKIAPARWYVNALLPVLIAMMDGVVVHNQFDRGELERQYGLRDTALAIVPHGPYNQYLTSSERRASADDGVCRLLYFGVIRPFKGVEDIVAALDSMTEEQADRFRLTVVGETWEGWTTPAEMIARSRYRDRITFVNRYVADDEVGGFFASADVVVLPYHRSSASGPLHLAMACGLPVVVTSVGGLVEAAEGYAGRLSVEPGRPDQIKCALLRASELRGERFEDLHSWDRTLGRYGELFSEIDTTNVKRRGSRR
jgi:glycosyltransferase involved in cell wall biosynthesis